MDDRFEADPLEALCARLCLLTRAAWRGGLPAPMSRARVRRLYEARKLCALALREPPPQTDADVERARALLSRTRDMAELVGRLKKRGYRALLPEEKGYPRELDAIGRDAPMFLFLRGNVGLLSRKRRVAVAGSRVIGEKTEALARWVGERMAWENIVMVSGGARGVDETAQRALLRAGGKLILVPAVEEERVLCDGLLRRALEEGRLLIVCDDLPDAGFSARRALGRNHVIYALGRAALVLAAREGAGGSWRGASDSLRGGFAPVFVPEGSGENPDQLGCRALLALGAGTFSPSDGRSLACQLSLCRAAARKAEAGF